MSTENNFNEFEAKERLKANLRSEYSAYKAVKTSAANGNNADANEYKTLGSSTEKSVAVMKEILYSRF
jgi:hypothetical protein